eukprot:gene12888-biopygen451
MPAPRPRHCPVTPGIITASPQGTVNGRFPARQPVSRLTYLQREGSATGAQLGSKRRATEIPNIFTSSLPAPAHGNALSPFAFSRLPLDTVHLHRNNNCLRVRLCWNVVLARLLLLTFGGYNDRNVCGNDASMVRCGSGRVHAAGLMEAKRRMRSGRAAPTINKAAHLAHRVSSSSAVRAVGGEATAR